MMPLILNVSAVLFLKRKCSRYLTFIAVHFHSLIAEKDLLDDLLQMMLKIKGSGKLFSKSTLRTQC